MHRLVGGRARRQHDVAAAGHDALHCRAGQGRGERRSAPSVWAATGPVKAIAIRPVARRRADALRIMVEGSGGSVLSAPTIRRGASRFRGRIDVRSARRAPCAGRGNSTMRPAPRAGPSIRSATGSSRSPRASARRVGVLVGGKSGLPDFLRVHPHAPSICSAASRSPSRISGRARSGPACPPGRGSGPSQALVAPMPDGGSRDRRIGRDGAGHRLDDALQHDGEGARIADRAGVGDQPRLVARARGPGP